MGNAKWSGRCSEWPALPPLATVGHRNPYMGTVLKFRRHIYTHTVATVANRSGWNDSALDRGTDRIPEVRWPRKIGQVMNEYSPDRTHTR